MADMTRDEDKELRARAICKDDYDIDGVKWACEGGCIHPKAGSVCPYLSAAEATMKAEADAGQDYEILLAKVAELEARCGELVGALKASSQAVDDWLHSYAGEMCDERRVEETNHRIADACGTLAYIADVQQHTRQTLKGDGSRAADVLAAAREWHKNMDDGHRQTKLCQAIDALGAGEGE